MHHGVVEFLWITAHVVFQDQNVSDEEETAELGDSAPSTSKLCAGGTRKRQTGDITSHYHGNRGNATGERSK